MEYEEDEEIPNVGVALSGSKNGRYAVKWALEKFVPQGINLFKLLYVRSGAVPFQMRDDVAAAYRKDVEWKTNVLLLPFKQMCSERQVEAEAIVIEASDVANAIAKEVVRLGINKLVIGISSRSAFTRKLKGDQMPPHILESAPSFCTVYVVSKGKLSSVRASTTSLASSIEDDRSSSISSSCRSSHASVALSEFTDTDSLSSISNYITPSLQSQRNQALRAINQKVGSENPGRSYHSSSVSMSIDEDTASTVSTSSEYQNGISSVSNYRSTRMDYQSWNLDNASLSDNMKSSSPSENQVDVGVEIERLRMELKQLQGIHEKAQIESVHASEKMKELNSLHTKENLRLKEICLREMKAREVLRSESEAREAAEKEVDFVRKCAELEALQRRDAEDSAGHDAKEKEVLEKALLACDQQYKCFEWEDIVSATSSFSDTLKIGIGANGTVYKGRLRHTYVAIKVLHSNDAHRTKQFQQELEILGRIRHPHLLLLLGSCPESGCLVYEYMENGSLDDRLKCKDNSPPLRWFHRFRIAWEVASALHFLHNSKPEPIVHRDLKPANILLGSNLVAKIGDVGLSTLVPATSTSFIMYKHTAPVGTFCYIDPEYQRTGMVSPRSDTYSLGIVILQLLTAKPPMGLAHVVETAMYNGCLDDILDSSAGKWPEEETRELAILGLGCAELRAKDRPDLQTKILPLLERLKNLADDALNLANESSAPPKHFICPILKEVMNEPCVASDGYTYDRSAIEMWFSLNDKSPLTNLPFPYKNLIPNHSLLSAIKEWKSAKESS